MFETTNQKCIKVPFTSCFPKKNHPAPASKTLKDEGPAFFYARPRTDFRDFRAPKGLS